MGQAKARWMEQQEEEYREAHWECPECETENVSEVDIPAVSEAGEAREMSASVDQEIECEGCDKIFKGTINNFIGNIEFDFRDENRDPIEIQHVSQHLDYGYEPYEEDYIWVPSDDPNDVFEVTIKGMRNLLRIDSPSEHDEQLLNRVIFSQIITALEAYLADTLINLVKGDKDIQHKLYTADKDLKKVKFEAAKIIKRPHIPESYLINWLQHKSFHDFPMVDDLFQAALGTSIYVNDENKTLLDAARHHRHDCVHRNGKTKDGDKLDIFDETYIRSIMSAAEALVSKIEWDSQIYKRDKMIEETVAEL